MKKYFLGSVGKAEAFRREGKELKLAFVSKTLTDSGLNISTTKDDIRGGQGAPIQFSFFHDPSVEITLTDIVFNHEYITAQLGATFDKEKESYKTVTKTVEAGATSVTLDEDILPIPFPCDDVNKYIVWASIAGQDNYIERTVDSDHRTVTGLEGGKTYCIRYLATDTNAKVAELTSMIIPEELFLIITAPIFAGDACSASKGKAAGHITFEVPRFQLNGAQEFAMNMSSNQTMSLAGIALASDSIECTSEGGKLLRIIEVLEHRDEDDDIIGLMVDSETAETEDTPSVYGELRDGHLAGPLALSKLTFNPTLDGNDKIKVADNNKVFTVTLNGRGISEKFYVGGGEEITINVTGGTAPTVKPKVYINEVETVTFTVTPNTNYHVSEVAIDHGTASFEGSDITVITDGQNVPTVTVTCAQNE